MRELISQGDSKTGNVFRLTWRMESGRLAAAAPESLRQYPEQGMHTRGLVLRNAP
jgi:hypothetical protein